MKKKIFNTIIIAVSVSVITVLYLRFTKEDNAQKRVEERVDEALSFCKEKGMNTNYCLMFDVQIHSGSYRMFVWDFNKKEIIAQSLCGHGCGKGNKKSSGSEPLFGNEEGSLLTSLGKYRIGARSYSNYGINTHYKLHGLESSNSNAFKRIIVLHSHTPVPEKEIYPLHLPMGWSQGCPVVSNDMMIYLDQLLQKEKKPLLLWIYY